MQDHPSNLAGGAEARSARERTSLTSIAELDQGLAELRDHVNELAAHLGLDMGSLTARVAEVEADRVRVIEIQRLAVSPNDVLIVTVGADTSPDDLDQLAMTVAKHLGTHRVLFMTEEVKVTVADLPPDDDTVADPLAGSPSPDLHPHLDA